MIEKIISDLAPPDSIQESLKKLDKDFLITRYANKGQNGYLFFGENRIQKKPVALKYYYYGDDGQYHEEPEYLTTCKSEYILPIHHAELVCEEWALFITDFCPNGDLEDRIQRSLISTYSAFDITLNILSGLSDLHCNNLVHRDLKPQNILIDGKGNPVIGDFGSVKKLTASKASIRGSGHSILYRPPESFKTNTYSILGDIYQIGMVLYQLLGGILPYDGLAYLNQKEMKKYNSLNDPIDQAIYVDSIIERLISQGKLLEIHKMPIWINKRTRQVIKKATNANPTKRYQSSSIFMNEIMKLKRISLDWKYDGKYICTKKKKEYRIGQLETGKYFVENRKHSKWRKMPDTQFMSLKQLIELIEKDLK